MKRLQQRPVQAGTLSSAWASALRGFAALIWTILLLGFLVALRIVNAPAQPDRELRLVELAQEHSLPPPPPPPPPPDRPAAAPPPPPPLALPRLELLLDESVPALKASVEPLADLTLEVSMFELDAPPTPSLARPGPAAPRTSPKFASRPVPEPASVAPAPRPEAPMRSTYDSGELDGTPRLRNHPAASYPPELLRQGIREGRVLLEVQINTSGSVSVRRVLNSSHPLFAAKARAIATGARFTVPTKNGRPVNAIYRWPIVIRP